MDEFLKEIFSKYGVLSLLGGFCAILVVWFTVHKMSEPGKEVSVAFGLVKYTKSSNGALPITAVPAPGKKQANDLSCLDYSGTWESTNLPEEDIERMKLIQLDCYVTGEITGGKFEKTVRGGVVGNKLEFDIQRKHGGCVNVLKAYAEFESENIISRDIPQVLGHCNEFTPSTKLPEVKFERG